MVLPSYNAQVPSKSDYRTYGIAGRDFVRLHIQVSEVCGKMPSLSGKSAEVTDVPL